MAVILERMAKGIQSDFTILEIVPYQGVGEYRFYAGSAEVETGILSKSASELNSLLTSSGGNKTNKKDQWFDIGSYFTGLGYDIRYNYRADKYDIKAEPLFQTNILTENARILLDGKIKVNTVEANKIKEEDLKNADLIVFTATASNYIHLREVRIFWVYAEKILQKTLKYKIHFYKSLF